MKNHSNWQKSTWKCDSTNRVLAPCPMPKSELRSRGSLPQSQLANRQEAAARPFPQVLYHRAAHPFWGWDHILGKQCLEESHTCWMKPVLQTEHPLTDQAFAKHLLGSCLCPREQKRAPAFYSTEYRGRKVRKRHPLCGDHREIMPQSGRGLLMPFLFL